MRGNEKRVIPFYLFLSNTSCVGLKVDKVKDDSTEKDQSQAEPTQVNLDLNEMVCRKNKDGAEGEI